MGGGKGGDSGASMEQAIQEQRAARAEARRENAAFRKKIALNTDITNPFGSAFGEYDPESGKIRAGGKANERYQKLYDNNIDRLNNFEQVGNNARDEALSVYGDAVRNRMGSDMNNLMSRVGTSDLRHSGVQSDVGRMAGDMQNRATRQLYDLGERARNAKLREIQSLSDTGYRPLMAQSSNIAQALGQANTAQSHMGSSHGSAAQQAMQHGNAMGNLFMQQAQMQRQQENDKKAGMGAMAGGVMNLGGSAFGL